MSSSLRCCTASLLHCSRLLFPIVLLGPFEAPAGPVNPAKTGTTSIAIPSRRTDPTHGAQNRVFGASATNPPTTAARTFSSNAFEGRGVMTRASHSGTPPPSRQKPPARFWPCAATHFEIAGGYATALAANGATRSHRRHSSSPTTFRNLTYGSPGPWAWEQRVVAWTHCVAPLVAPRLHAPRVQLR